MAERDMDWILDFARRCVEAGTDAGKIMRCAGYDDREIAAAMRGRSLCATDKVLLESELVSYGTPPAEKDEEPDPEPEPVPGPAPPEICDGDKINCPYLTRIGRKGFCMMPRCMYIIKREDVDDQARADAGQEPARGD